MNLGNQMGAVATGLIVGIYMHLIGHELGHLIFGKLSGYEFVSFRIGKWMLIKEGGRFKQKRFNIVGTGGQCLMMPPKESGTDFPYVLYNMGGCLINLILSSVSSIALSQMTRGSGEWYFLLTVTIMGFLFIIMNGVPMQIGGVANDGYNLKELHKSKSVREAFGLQLKVNGLMTRGIKLSEMPRHWFEMPKEEELSHGMICARALLVLNYHHEKQAFKEAREVCEMLLTSAPGLMGVQRNEVNCEYLFYNIIQEKSKETIETLYSKELKKYIEATADYPSRQRLLYAYALLIRGDKAEAQLHKEAFEECAKIYPFKGEIESERAIMEWISLLGE